MMSAEPHSATIYPRIAEIGRTDWDVCARNGAYLGNPFITFDFLDSLEEAGCAVERQGWGPQHVLVRDREGRALGAMPLYLKGHSQGEYIFDHAWASAYERAGGRYYPKLLSASPFTPATGPRLLIAPDAGAEAVRSALLGAALNLCQRRSASSLHVNFPEDEEWRWLGDHGLALRQGVQYHWVNQGFSDFEDFLQSLSSGRRKTIRRERREAQAGVEIEVLSGRELTEAHWDAFFAFYMDTGARKWGRPYLNRLFFSLLGERMGDQVVLVMARRGARWIAGALNLAGQDCLYGRNWGCVEDVPFLHFELCYYQAIDWAIRNGKARVEAGAQGEHKISRGYLPSPVRSAHYIADPALRGPVARFVEEERAQLSEEMEWLAEAYSPYRRGG